MGAAELSHAADQERQHDPDRPGEIAAGHYAVYFHCQTDLVETFRELYPTQLRFERQPSILLDVKDELPRAELRHCVALALTYHFNKRKAHALDSRCASGDHAASPPISAGASEPRRTAPATA